jgi:hypothetical protein
LCTTVAYKMLSFLDIQSLDDFWDWLPNHFAPMWYANQRGDSLQKFKVADGFRCVAGGGTVNGHAPGLNRRERVTLMQFGGCFLTSTWS